MESKVEVSVGCMEFLISEVEKDRKKIEILSAENRVMNNFFNLVNRIGDQKHVGFEEDRLWQAKKEFEAAKNALVVRPEAEF